MGADGGFSYTRIKDFRDNWKEIKENLKEGCETNEYTYSWDREDMEELGKLVPNMPDTLENMSDKDIIKMLEPFKSCDCPCIIEGYLLITGNGDNVPVNMNILDSALYKFSGSVETWT
jgi:hypothetical protein